ncbi:MAG: hypothetical protein K0R75_1809 [Paenibacillaceae bacterium]|nr:hypothetical protein [Paenibacillaceae bacterium]
MRGHELILAINKSVYWYRIWVSGPLSCSMCMVFSIQSGLELHVGPILYDFSYTIGKIRILLSNICEISYTFRLRLGSRHILPLSTNLDFPRTIKPIMHPLKLESALKLRAPTEFQHPTLLPQSPISINMKLLSLSPSLINCNSLTSSIRAESPASSRCSPLRRSAPSMTNTYIFPGSDC